MNETKFAAAVALACALALGSGVVIAAKAQGKTEKCYGVAKAGKNDCQTATSSCAGSSKKDAQADAWLAVPAGTCGKLVGGSLEAKKG